MKKLILLVLIINFSQQLSFGQTSDSSSLYYVVIGGFAKLDNAINYTARARKDTKLISITKDKSNPQYQLNSKTNLNYVYILETTDKRAAFALNIKLKAQTEYKDSWVFKGKFNQITGPKKAQLTPAVVEEKPKTETTKELIAEKKDTLSGKQPVIVEPAKTEPIVNADSSSTAKIKQPSKEEAKVEDVPGKPFVFKLANKSSGKEVTGAAHLYESARASEYQSFSANGVALVPPPRNKTGTYVVKIQAPGYKPEEKTVKFGEFDPNKKDYKETVVSFSLTKVKSGDYIDFNNVHFIKNSPLMNPDSKNELDGLVDLMKENPDYKIKIHGFCNGVEKREIISRGTSDKFFELEPEKNKKQKKSAKELSHERAEIIKAYLVSQGIEEKRLSIKAEGGDIPLYAEKGAMASHNDRVEIEIKTH